MMDLNSTQSVGRILTSWTTSLRAKYGTVTNLFKCKNRSGSTCSPSPDSEANTELIWEYGKRVPSRIGVSTASHGDGRDHYMDIGEGVATETPLTSPSGLAFFAPVCLPIIAITSDPEASCAARPAIPLLLARVDGPAAVVAFWTALNMSTTFRDSSWAIQKSDLVCGRHDSETVWECCRCGGCILYLSSPSSLYNAKDTTSRNPETSETPSLPYRGLAFNSSSVGISHPVILAAWQLVAVCYGDPQAASGGTSSRHITKLLCSADSQAVAG